ncbi:MAG: hypothetical protein H6611_03710 [Ignavibacteriales bacterium]|nr:hypothetical protein [Ignavibacteriales bacterium]
MRKNRNFVEHESSWESQDSHPHPKIEIQMENTFYSAQIKLEIEAQFILIKVNLDK